MSKSKKVIQRLVKKATSREQKYPNEKYIKAIILRTFNTEDDTNDQAVKALTKRLERTSWAVVLKSLIVIHCCYRDGDDSFIEKLLPKYHQVFALRFFKECAPSNNMHTIFVTKYARYLREKVSVLRLLGYQFERNKDAVKNLEIPKNFKIVSKLQSQFNALLNCKLKVQFVSSDLINRTYVLLMKDSLPLYTLLNDAIVQLLNLFWKIKIKRHAKKILTIYELYCKEIEALLELYEDGGAFVRDLPVIEQPEISVIDSMEKYVDGLIQDSDSSDHKERRRRKSSRSRRNAESSAGSVEEFGDKHEGEIDQRDYKDKDKESEEDEEPSSEEDPVEDKYFENFFKNKSTNSPYPANHTNTFQNQTGAPFLKVDDTFAQKKIKDKRKNKSSYNTAGSGSSSPLVSKSGDATNPFISISNPFGEVSYSQNPNTSNVFGQSNNPNDLFINIPTSNPVPTKSPSINIIATNNSPFNNSPHNNSPFNNSPFNSPHNNSPFNNSPFNNSPFNSPHNNSPFNSTHNNSPFYNSTYNNSPLNSPHLPFNNSLNNASFNKTPFGNTSSNNTPPMQINTNTSPILIQKNFNPFL